MAIENYGKKKDEEYYKKLPYSQAKKEKEKERRKKMRADVSRAGRTDAEKERERILLSNPTSRNSYVFTNPQTGDREEFFGVEYTEFNAWPNQRIIHGIITISEFDNNGVKTGERSDDIFMYQPRFEGRNRFVLGPLYKSDGRLNNNAAYAYRNPKNGQIYVGSIPKREIISNREFDFDQTNMANFEAACENLEIKDRSIKKVVSIKYDTDSQGYVKSLDLSNINDLNRLKAYCEKYSTPAIADDMIDNYIHRIEKELEKFERMTDEMEEAVSRVGLANRYQAQASSTPQPETTSSPSSLADENALLINNMLKYGIRPSYASPVDDGYGGLEIGRGAPTPPPPPPHHGGRGR